MNLSKFNTAAAAIALTAGLAATAGAQTAPISSSSSASNSTSTSTANVTTGDQTVNTAGTVSTGAIQNNVNFKRSASSAYSNPNGNSGHDCFEGQGGWGVGLQVYVAGASGGYGGGEKYNTVCVKDKVILTIIENAAGPNATPAEKALAVQAAANKAEEINDALKTVRDDKELRHLFTPVATNSAQPPTSYPVYINGAPAGAGGQPIPQVDCSKFPGTHAEFDHIRKLWGCVPG